jgi:mono/diheme cytochrome c family protein
MKTASMRLVVWLPLLTFAGGCDLPGKPDPANKFVYPDKVTDFATLFGKNCAGCHGAEGRFGPAPPLNDLVFLAIVPDEELIMTISRGRAGTSMPAFADSRGGTLTAAQIRVLAEGIRTHWTSGLALARIWPPYVAVAKGDAKRGAAVFAKSCKECHGDEGKGTEKIGPINDPAFLALSSEQVLRRFVIAGRADLGMPNCLEVTPWMARTPLDAAGVDDVVALLMSWKTK